MLLRLFILHILCKFAYGVLNLQSGFLYGSADDTAILLKVVNKVSCSYNCRSFVFNNPEASHFKNGVSKTFDLVPNKLVNDRPVWSNGNYYISFIAPSDSVAHGTWIVGNEPGVDNGFGYYKPTSSTILPYISPGDDTNKWYWLRADSGSKWQPNRDTSLVCDDLSGASHFFSVQYVDNESGVVTDSHLVPTNKSNNEFQYLNTTTKTWTKLLMDAPAARKGHNGSTLPQVSLIPFGEPVVVKNVYGREWIAILVKEEHVWDANGWRLFFRVLYHVPSEKQLIPSGKDMTPLEWLRDIQLSSPRPSNQDWRDILSAQPQALDAGLGPMHNTEEVVISIDVHGAMYDYSVHPLPLLQPGIHRLVERNDNVEASKNTSDGPADTVDLSLNTILSFSSLMSIKVNDYVTFWLSDIMDNKATDIFARCLSHSTTTISSKNHPWLYEGTAVFQFYPTDRRDIMGRSALSEDIDVLSVSWSWGASSIDVTTSWTGVGLIQLTKEAAEERTFQYTVALGGRNARLHSVVNHFSFAHVTAMIKKYLYANEKQYGKHLSSCFLYHAAMSLPPQLVYAAEIMCCLLGGKPVVMIQYVSKTDQQTKFPLVRELVRTIVAAKSMHDAKIDVNVTVHKYQSDETLVIYRQRHEALAGLLRPAMEAQALHIVPYPSGDAALLQGEQEAQIYNSFWNGYVLGYPLRFVDSYCIDFHNDLTRENKIVVYQQARQDVEKYFKQNKLVRVPIGLHPTESSAESEPLTPVDPLFWTLLEAFQF